MNNAASISARLLALALLLLSEAVMAQAGDEIEYPDATKLKRMTSRFAPVDLDVDVSNLPDSERACLGKLVQASEVLDALFLRQAWAGNESMLLELLRDNSPLGKERLHAFLIDKGPWARLDSNAPFVPGAPAKPRSANFYPSSSTKEEVAAWMNSLPAPERAKAAGFFTTIRKGPDGKLVAVPYSFEYQGELERVASLLEAAEALSQQDSLKAFLRLRAAAFLSNDYYDSDVAWMKLDASIEPTIGPYEVYEDEWFNYKAAFEAFIAIRDDADTAKLARFSDQLQDVEDHLPIDPKFRNPKLGALAPIRVVNLLFSAGDGNHGVQTAAFNLPNDERITKEMGTKRVMLKNVQEAKFKKVLLPVAKVALAASDQKNVSFDAFFTHILMHELMHGLGPHAIVVDGKPTTVRERLQEAYSAIEEAKADISGLWALQYLIDKGALDKSLEKTMYVTFLASAFRSIRFGVTEAHGKGQAIQLNYLFDHGGFRQAKGGTFSVDPSKIKEAVTSLTHDFMTLQAEGDKSKADEMISRLGVIRPEVQHILDSMKNVPVDIEPRYATAEKLLQETR
jgi:hypothetical protein